MIINIKLYIYNIIPAEVAFVKCHVFITTGRKGDCEEQCPFKHAKKNNRNSKHLGADIFVVM